MIICVEFGNFILRSTSVVDITGVSGAEETLSVGGTPYKIKNGSVMLSNVSSQLTDDESDDNITDTRMYMSIADHFRKEKRFYWLIKY